MGLKISQLTSAPALSGDELFEIAESGSSLSVPASGVLSYIQKTITKIGISPEELGYFLTSDLNGNLSFAPSGISNVVEDVTPQLGGNLDVGDYSIITEDATTAKPINIIAGDSAGGNYNPHVIIRAGGGNYFSYSANATIQGGNGVQSGTHGGVAYVKGGEPEGGAGAGGGFIGSIEVRGGLSNNEGGAIVVSPGNAKSGENAAGGQLTLKSGSAFGTVAAGKISLDAGNNNSSGDGGDIEFNPGKSSSGADGVIKITTDTGATTSIEVRFHESDAGSQYISLKAPDSISTNRVWVLPIEDPTTVNGYPLTTNASGELSFSSVVSGSSLNAENGYTGSFLASGGQTVTVKNGIITSVA